MIYFHSFVRQGRIGRKDDNVSLQVGAGLGAVGAAVLGPVVQVWKITQI